MPVNTIHPDYTNALQRWTFVRDVVEGMDAVKKKKTTYLPATFAPDTSDSSTKQDADKVRYDQYIGRAYLMGVASRTCDALSGMVFRKEPIVNIPESIQNLIENVDGSGQSVNQLAKETVTELLKTGRFGLLADYPEVPEGMTRQSEMDGGYQPYIASYPAESIINWRFEGVNGRKRLTLVVLKEAENKATDEFSHDTQLQYRVLRLVDGVYTQTLYDTSGKESIAEYAPKMAGGKTFDYIPFHIVGSTNNYPNPDISPLYDLSVINIAHYQSTAELKENQFFSAQGTLHLDVGDMDARTFKDLNPNGVVIGRRTGLVTSGGGSATLIQGDSRQQDILATMEREESEMVAIGARLVMRSGQAETAEASRINASAEASTLDTLVENASEAIEAALEDCGRFVGVNPEQVEFALNKQFWESGLTAQDLGAIIQGVGKVYGAVDAIEMIKMGKIWLNPEKESEEILQQAAESFINEQME